MPRRGREAVTGPLRVHVDDVGAQPIAEALLELLRSPVGDGIPTTLHCVHEAGYRAVGDPAGSRRQPSDLPQQRDRAAGNVGIREHAQTNLVLGCGGQLDDRRKRLKQPRFNIAVLFL